ncbi:cytochrome c biogenesis protein CcdA [Dactylosporangium sp. NBC_01737]|uniref:cytochrome c biogenesis CcdA family protein n=1 Tax=Dactylosporangium sp. NBC_01737 TaxID=2975959 RepID=UPI002E1124D1|nr:cytochrome c biogenesis protein CcdA [Dactylosporangium sp. NBC_01737]
MTCPVSPGGSPDVSDLGLALGAGLLAAVNPCGFALLPVYLMVLVLGDDTPSRSLAVRRALTATGAMTAGFVAVFGTAGLLLAPVIGAVHQVLPWFTTGFGLLVAGVGGWVVAGRALPSFVRPPARGPAVRRSPVSMIAFGMAYAASSLSCTIAPFLAIVVSSFRAGSVLDGVGLFVAYAAGMGLLVGLAALGVALSRPRALTGLRRFGPALSRAGGVVLLLAGGYVAYYGFTEARGDVDDPVIGAAANLQRHLATAVEHVGVPAFAALFGVLLAIVVLVTVLRGRSARRRAGPT